MNAYQESLKVYRDNKNTMDYAIETAVEEAVQKAVKVAVQDTREEMQVHFVKELRKAGSDIPFIANVVKLSIEEVKDILGEE